MIDFTLDQTGIVIAEQFFQRPRLIFRIARYDAVNQRIVKSVGVLNPVQKSLRFALFAGFAADDFFQRVAVAFNQLAAHDIHAAFRRAL